MRCNFHKISIEKKQLSEIEVSREIYRESEVEDELEGELSKLLEEKVAEDDEAWTDKRKTRCSAIHRRQNLPIVCRQIPRRHRHRHRHHWEDASRDAEKGREGKREDPMKKKKWEENVGRFFFFLNKYLIKISMAK